jgi:hypothetical protein
MDHRSKLVTGAMALVLLGTIPLPGFAAQAQPATATAGETALESGEVARIRAELGALRQEYEGRLAALEARLATLESGRPGASQAAAATPAPATTEPAAVPPSAPAEAPAAAAPTATAAVPPGAAGEGGPSALPVYGGGAASSKVFNPDIAAIGDFIGVAGKSPGGGELSSRSSSGAGAPPIQARTENRFVTVRPKNRGRPEPAPGRAGQVAAAARTRLASTIACLTEEAPLRPRTERPRREGRVDLALGALPQREAHELHPREQTRAEHQLGLAPRQILFPPFA